MIDEPRSPPIASEVAKSSVGLASFLAAALDSALASCFAAAGFTDGRISVSIALIISSCDISSGKLT